MHIAKINENGMLALKVYNSYIYIWGIQNMIKFKILN